MYKFGHYFLSKIDPELAHNISINAFKFGLYPKINHQQYEVLEQIIWGRGFKTPIGLAAGFDKNAEVINALFNLGFSFVEVGTVTPLPQKGNPKPRIHRFHSEKALINSLGFNNKGSDQFKKNILKSNIKNNSKDRVLGINIGNNKNTEDILDDLKKLFEDLYRFGDYITVNLSSPNTPGLRDNLKSNNFDRIVKGICKLREENNSKIPILFKISPDILPQDKKDIALIALSNDIEGLILTNTTINKNLLRTDLKGGVSGKPLLQKSNDLIRDFYTLTSGKIKIIGVGGVFSAEDILQKMHYGASLIQLYTSFIFNGPYYVDKLNKDLSQIVQEMGYKNISEIIGIKA
ncbi:MAG: quinone-dependent dihydroorotate dehydrogenase [Proteobacteria bacterium]|nr:quinone-dependent dihydroorotate dehydrogenase [Pseudomonadota bacterium]